MHSTQMLNAGHTRRLGTIQRCLWVILGTLIATPLAARPHGFTFRDAEFMPLDRGVAAAQDFVAARLPPGLPLAEARDRLRRADMRCASARHGGAIVCAFTEVVHVEGGVLGESRWTVRLTDDGSGRLASATADHAIIGAGNPGL